MINSVPSFLPFSWESFIQEIKDQLDPMAFESWIVPLALNHQKDQSISISAPSSFIKQWFLENYKDLALLILKNKFNILHLEIAVLNNNNSSPNLDLKQDISASDKEPEELNNNNEQFALNPDYTFESFVVGKSNEFAYNVSLKFAQEEAMGVNTFFLYGNSGLGKTHLMHSIAWELKKNNKKKFLYLTAEKFMNLYITALRDKNIINFKEIFRSTDVLMIDDFQFLNGKESTQEEFFHTFNTLISQGKQIIFSADTAPLGLNRMEERIISRLQGGLVANINATTYELRIGILESKIKKLNCKIPKDVVDFLANTITDNVRVLEGALKRIISYHRVMNVKIDLNMCMEVLSDILKHKNKIIDIELIQKKVAEHFNVKLADLSSTKRDKNTAHTRQIAMYIAKTITKNSLAEIGHKFGGKDHTTVLYAIKKINEEVSTNSNLDSTIKMLINIIQKS
jgi:chromosomal replication initiator protein